jgi:predicted nucleic acid-binding protein
MIILLDSNILLDIFTKDPIWFDATSNLLEQLSTNHQFAINPIIYSEISIGFKDIESLEKIIPPNDFLRLDLPWESSFLAGKCYIKYKKNKGLKSSLLPDFLIGAHAAVSKLGLMTRDISRYKTYFPTVELFIPKLP